MKKSKYDDIIGLFFGLFIAPWIMVGILALHILIFNKVFP